MDYPTHSTVLAEIEHRFGFVPPFFGPAVQTPEVLENLWRQTLTAYVDNPLPDLFKEKVSAYLSRYCAASYCLVCHTCSLRPLGMSGADVLELLRSPALSDPEARTLARKLETEARKGVFPLAESWEEAAVIALSGVLYLAGPIAPVARTALRELLADNDYNRLVTLILYVKTCHGWVESQPSISFTVDDRYKKHFRPLVEEEPGLHRYFQEYLAAFGQAHGDTVVQAESVAGSRAAEAHATIELLEKRLLSVLDDRRKAAEFAQELVAIVSHDLRNPLSAIQASAALLLRVSGQDARVIRAANRILMSTERSGRLVGDLLDFTQACVGNGIPVQPSSTDIHALTRHSVDEIRAAHPGRRIELTQEGDGCGEWDEDRLSQVLGNLLGNSVAHSPEEGTVEVQTTGEEGQVRIRLHNGNKAGPIPPSLLPTLFEPFKRGAEHVSQSKGIGLGLYIVRRIVDAHRGDVNVSSDEQGTTFELVLPRRPVGSSHSRLGPGTLAAF